MQYRNNFVKLQVKNIVDLFDMNDKSEVTIYSHDSSDLLFKGRVDYLQYTIEGEMSQLCSLEIESLEVNGGEFIIYVNKTENDRLRELQSNPVRPTIQYSFEETTQKSLEEITDEIVDLYEKGIDSDEIARLCSIPNYLVQSILVSSKDVHFR